MTINQVDSRASTADAMVSIEEAILAARAMMAKQEDADREMRHSTEALQHDANAERISHMRDAANSKFAGAIVEASCDAVSIGADCVISDKAKAFKNAADTTIHGARAALGGLFTKQAGYADADAAAAADVASRFDAVAEDRRADASSAEKSSERLQDAFSAVERARAESRLASTRG